MTRGGSVVYEEWSDQLLYRRWAEKFEPNLREYAAKGSLSVNPLNVEAPQVEELTARIGPTWMFAPAGKSALKQWFGRDFADEEIEAYRTNPRKGEEMVIMLESLVKAGKLKPEVAEFYRKALTYEGRMKIYCTYSQRYGVPCK